MVIFQYHAYFEYKARLCILDLWMSVRSLIKDVNFITTFEAVCVPSPLKSGSIHIHRNHTGTTQKTNEE